MAVRNRYRMARPGSRRYGGMSPALRLTLVIIAGLVVCFLVGMLLVFAVRGIVGLFTGGKPESTPSMTPSMTLFSPSPSPSASIAQVLDFKLSTTGYNPLAGNLDVTFEISAPTEVYMAVLDSSGTLVAEIANWQMFTAGAHPLQWDGRTAAGEFAPEGTYKMQLQIGQGGQALSTGSLPFTITSAGGTPSPSASATASASAARTATATTARTATPRPTGTATPTPKPSASPSATAKAQSFSLSTTSYNPTSGTGLSITFALDADTQVNIQVLDINGNVVATLSSWQDYTAGNHTVAWNGLTSSGVATNGYYYVQMQTGASSAPVSSGTQFFVVTGPTASPTVAPTATATPVIRPSVEPTETYGGGTGDGDGQVPPG